MLFTPGSAEYDRATAPDNTIVGQHPAAVAVARSADDVVTAVAEAASRGLTVLPQATGHGAGVEVGDDALLLNTSELAGVEIDDAGRTARLGAGVTWGVVNGRAERVGLLGLAGSSPTVAVSGYTFGGGIGWLSRRDGLCSAALRTVEYVDGAGALRTASDDAVAELDRQAILAFRGGGGVGIAVSLEVDLAPVPDLHCGHLLWPATDLDAVVRAWVDAIPGLGSSTATSISVLHTPQQGPFPDELLNGVVVHLAVADPDGPDGAADLLRAVRRTAAPTVDDWGPGDAEKLGTIHLDPPGATSALGDSRWLDDTTTDLATDLFRVAVDPESPVVMMELRHVAGPPARRDGVLVAPPGPFLYHAVGAVGRAEPPAIRQSFDQAAEVWRPAYAGLAQASWMEGAAQVPDGLAPDTRDRLRDLSDRIDPDHHIARPRVLRA